VAQLYCWSCGRPVPLASTGLAPLCSRCTAAGPQHDGGDLRFMIRTADGSARGPLSREAVRDQLVRGALQAVDRISREGGDWATMDTHADFRAYFLPGTPEFLHLHSEQDNNRRERLTDDVRRRGKATGAMAAAAASVALAVGASAGGWFVLPEAVGARVRGFLEDARATVGGSIQSAVDQDAAVRAVAATKDLPGQEVVDASIAAHPDVEGPAALHLARGRTALWDGRAGSAAEARVHFERALALAPRDPEAASGLAQAMALLYASDPDLGTPMSKAAERADAAAPDSVAGLQARVAVARASGSAALALDLASRCGDPPSMGGMPGERVDLGCAIAAAALGGNEGALSALERRFPEAYPIRVARMQAALERGDLSLAVALGERLAGEAAEEPAAHVVLASAYTQLGRFDDALAEAGRVGVLEPDRLAVRRLHADLLLKRFSRPREALAEYESLLAHEGFVRLSGQAQVFADASAAALATGAGDRCIELADKALEIDRGSPAAALHKARALVQRGDKAGAEAALRDADTTRTTGHALSRFHVGAARVYLAVGRERLAVNELVNAREADPFWAVAALETARTRLKVNDLVGAIDLIESVAYMDAELESSRTPLHDIWYPATDWSRLKQEIERGLVGDVRFASRGAGVVGVVAWAGGMPTARRELERAIKNGDEVPAAHAALAQLMLGRGDMDGARFHAGAVLAAMQDRAVIRAVKGRAMITSGDVSGGAAEINKALQDDPSNPGVRRHAAVALEKRGDTAGAAEAWREVLRLAPGDVGARRALLALEKSGR